MTKSGIGGGTSAKPSTQGDLEKTVFWNRHKIENIDEIHMNKKVFKIV